MILLHVEDFFRDFTLFLFFAELDCICEGFAFFLESFSSHSAIILDFDLLLVLVTLAINELLVHALLGEGVSGRLALHRGFHILLAFGLSLQVAENATRTDFDVFDVDALEPHSPSLEERFEFSIDP